MILKFNDMTEIRFNLPLNSRLMADRTEMIEATHNLACPQELNTHPWTRPHNGAYRNYTDNQ